MRKTGRPMAEIDQKKFEKLCGLQCTEQEICSFFDVTDKTLNRWCKRTYKMGFSEIFKQKRGIGKISLRRAQFLLANKSAAMAIFLGKNYLGQSDHDKNENGDKLETRFADDGLTAALASAAKKAWDEDDQSD